MRSFSDQTHGIRMVLVIWNRPTLINAVIPMQQKGCCVAESRLQTPSNGGGQPRGQRYASLC